MLGDGGGDPRMGQLEQQRPARAEKDRRLLVDLPRHRARAERAGRVLGCGIADEHELAVEIAFADYKASFLLARHSQCAISTGTSAPRSTCRVNPPKIHSRRRLRPYPPITSSAACSAAADSKVSGALCASGCR